ncbi:hypothetical protein [Microvirga tunisiensis]|uniref:Uncharacterized protein n=1 Tax=Microvirga tunisiensis TaxID=2108360 RepID=A0A5N7MQA0_9HYPH|nr:hypothetical protein [Microvirga tunisiensis]MPR11115.1 hypothetical protein [Microvirga tunisiensis]MPR29202.1 hypothetical protein [Microvirga tunisiensis]
MEARADQEDLLRNDAQRQHQLAGIAASLEAPRERLQHGLAKATFEQRRQLVLLLVHRVVVTNDELEIHYVLPISLASEHVRFCQLRKDYFNHPSAWQRLKALLLGQPAHDLDHEVPTGRLAHQSPAIVAEKNRSRKDCNMIAIKLQPQRCAPQSERDFDFEASSGDSS